MATNLFVRFFFTEPQDIGQFKSGCQILFSRLLLCLPNREDAALYSLHHDPHSPKLGHYVHEYVFRSAIAGTVTPAFKDNFVLSKSQSDFHRFCFNIDAGVLLRVCFVQDLKFENRENVYEAENALQ